MLTYFIKMLHTFNAAEKHLSKSAIIMTLYSEHIDGSMYTSDTVTLGKLKYDCDATYYYT